MCEGRYYEDTSNRIKVMACVIQEVRLGDLVAPTGPEIWSLFWLAPSIHLPEKPPGPGNWFIFHAILH